MVTPTLARPPALAWAGAIFAAAMVLSTAAPAGAATPAVSFVQRVGGLVQPTQVTSAKDGSGRLFVTEKTGRVRLVVGGRLRSRTYLDLRRLVRTDGEGGLLSIAFHPDFAAHPYLWAAYTDSAGDLRVARFRAPNAAATSVPLSSYRRVIDAPHPRYSNHYGGQLVFLPDGTLVVSTGDGGSAGDPSNHAQDVTSLAGKLLRLKVLGAQRTCRRAYCIPLNNPLAGASRGRPEIWALGLRNAWRFSLDATTGDLWLGDVGQDAYEEIDRLPAGVAGANFGWSCREGPSSYAGERCRRGRAYLGPQWSYDHSYGESVVGGFVYRGSRFAASIGGAYLGGDYVSGRVFLGTSGGLQTVGRLPKVTSFGQDDNRELWAVTLTGGLYQLEVS